MKPMHKYQKRIVDWIITHPRCGIFVDMGYGKTRATLAAIAEKDGPTLIVGPPRVIETVWYQEAIKWGIDHLVFSQVTGSPSQRTFAINAKADVYLISAGNLPWLKESFGESFNFNTLVLDESSMFKTPGSKRSKAALWFSRRAKDVILLTGTPSPNGLADLYHQIKILDAGERLGKSVPGFRKRWCYPENPYFEHTKWLVIPEREEAMRKKISDICMSLEENDMLDLPGRMVNDISIPLPGKNRRYYDELREEMWVETELTEISAKSAGALVNKLQQYTSGAVYPVVDDHFQYTVEHDEKMKALDEIITEAAGQPIIVWYGFVSTGNRILEKYGKTLNVRHVKDEDAIKEWNQGKIDILLAHPASGGHGLNLQHGGHIAVWFDLPYNLEYYQQANARLDRQGQEHPVMIHRLIVEDSIDGEVAEALENKRSVQDLLMKELQK